LDQEIRDLKAIQQQVQRKKEKMLHLADLQKKIDEAADQDRRPQRRELREENSYDDDKWYDDFHHGNFAFDDASPLSAELQATPWPPSYKPPLQSWRNPSSWQSRMSHKLGTLLFGQEQSHHGTS
jgi:hypothetical protein